MIRAVLRGVLDGIRHPEGVCRVAGDEGDERHAATAVTIAKRLLTRQ